MKILLLSTDDIKGGAARSAYRLHMGLQNIAVKPQMLVQLKYGDDSSVIGSSIESGVGKMIGGFRLTVDQLPLKFYPQRLNSSCSLQWLPERLSKKVKQLNPDLINLHWIQSGFLSIETIAQFQKPIIWTLHDMWSFTGVCNYNQDCDRYQESCGACPQLGSKQDWDLSRWNWQRKNRAWQNLNLTIVTPSRWLANCAKASSLFKNRRIEVIPYGINLKKYQPYQPQQARQLLGLPQDKQLILFLSLSATSDRRKGFHLLQPALLQLKNKFNLDEIELIIVGASQPDNPPDLGFRAHYLGTLNDDLTLALAYSAADVFVAPSLQDNFPNTVLESLACGTPCVAFEIGGMPDMIDHQQNGYLAMPYQIDDLANGIEWILRDRERYIRLTENARAKMEREFQLETQAHRYLSLFAEILSDR